MRRYKEIMGIGLLAALSAGCASVGAGSGQAVSTERYVNPLIGTAHSETKAAGLFGKGTEELGQTLPAVLMPNGMNFWTPQTRDTEQKCIAPYYYADSLLQGFRNSHWIVGGCTQDYGSMTLMPLFGSLRTTPELRAVAFSHSDEKASPSEYKVAYTDAGARVEVSMTGTSRAAIFNVEYDGKGTGYLVVNPNSDEGMGAVEIDLAKRRITGLNPVHRIYQGWGEEAGFSGYFAVEWLESLKIDSCGTYRGEEVFKGEHKISDARDIGAWIAFHVDNDAVKFRVGSSFTSVDAAIANLNAEIPDYDYDATRERLASVWENHLGRIEVEGGSETDREKFYSALYRASFLPHVISDCDGSYPAFSGGEIRKMSDNGEYYDDFSMWDTYRALHPLLNIIQPSRNGKMMQSLVTKYEQGGWLPIFPCWNSYTAAMIGDHCAATLADAYVKGTGGFDAAKAWEAIRKNAFETPSNPADYRDGMGRRALRSYLEYGYIPVEDSVPDAFHKREQASRTLEYAFDDFAASQLAKDFGTPEEYKELKRRSSNWKNAVNPATGYAAARRMDGTFVENDPFTFAKEITEGAPCHYAWYVPHDVEGLIEWTGGSGKFESRLDSMFTQRRYWHGNEPCHQVAWLFPYVGKPEKTARNVRHIMETEYLNTPGGLSGNDDAGQMSAWYVFAALGFYPVAPATPEYIVGLPLFEKATINLENGKQFTIEAPGVSEGIEGEWEMLLNGKPVEDFRLSHSAIMEGGTLLFRKK